MKLMQFGDSSCARIRRYLDSYINNELLVETNHEVLRHLETCPACAADVETRTRIKARLKSAVQNQSVPEDLQARLRAALREESRGSFAWTRWASAAAAVLVVAAGLWFELPRWTRPALPDLADRRGQDVFIQKLSAGSGLSRPGSAGEGASPGGVPDHSGASMRIPGAAVRSPDADKRVEPSFSRDHTQAARRIDAIADRFRSRVRRGRLSGRGAKLRRRRIRDRPIPGVCRVRPGRAAKFADCLCLGTVRASVSGCGSQLIRSS